jgi:hypothetical protein
MSFEGRGIKNKKIDQQQPNTIYWQQQHTHPALKWKKKPTGTMSSNPSNEPTSLYSFTPEKTLGGEARGEERRGMLC